MVFGVAFVIPWLLVIFLDKRKYLKSRLFILLLLWAPLLFAIKISVDFSFDLSENTGWNRYWNTIVYWPLLFVVITGLLIITWKIFHPGDPFYGIKAKGFDWKPYFLMLLVMLPLIALASTQKDFLSAYPKLQYMQEAIHPERLGFWHKIFYELSYGTDFITIEFFFRSFLVLAFAKWAGKDAILPMACFYCAIHFGKPLGECISSYFGGIILGIIVYNTRSIWGGLLVHLGIAWLMEIGGYIGNSFQ